MAPPALPVAVELIGDEEELVHRIDGDARAGVDLVGVVGAGQLRGGDARHLVDVVELDLRVQFGRRRGDAGVRIDGEAV